MFSIAQAAAADRLTLDKVLSDIPHDVPAIIVYLMVLVFVVLVWRGSRKTPT